MQVRVTPASKEQGQAEVLAEGTGSTQWTVEEDSYKLQLRQKCAVVIRISCLFRYEYICVYYIANMFFSSLSYLLIM